MDDGEAEKIRRNIANERAKLLAQAFDRAGTGCLVVGLLAPLAAGAPFAPSASLGSWSPSPYMA